MVDSFLKFWKPTPEEVLATVEQGQKDRAQRLADETRAQQQAEHQVKLDKLHQVEHALDQKIARKAELLTTIRVALTDLYPALAELDVVEAQGQTLGSQVLGLQIEAGQPIGHGWHDAPLPGCADLVKRWLRKLEA
jgi:phosphoglycolate phosphatase-like HAD superfamily hydrolase